MRYAAGKQDRDATLLAETIDGRAFVQVLGSPGAGLAAKRTTATISVVVVSGEDPVAQGLVASVNRPGGNNTAIGRFTGELVGKQLGLLLDLVPEATQTAFLVNPNNPNAAPTAAAAMAAAQRAGREFVVVNAATEGAIDVAFATLAERKIRVLLTDPDPFLNSWPHHAPERFGRLSACARTRRAGPDP